MADVGPELDPRPKCAKCGASVELMHSVAGIYDHNPALASQVVTPERDDVCPECGGSGMVLVRFNYGDVEQECGLCDGPRMDAAATRGDDAGLRADLDAAVELIRRAEAFIDATNKHPQLAKDLRTFVAQMTLSGSLAPPKTQSDEEG